MILLKYCLNTTKSTKPIPAILSEVENENKYLFKHKCAHAVVELLDLSLKKKSNFDSKIFSLTSPPNACRLALLSYLSKNYNSLLLTDWAQYEYFFGEYSNFESLVYFCNVSVQVVRKVGNIF